MENIRVIFNGEINEFTTEFLNGIKEDIEKQFSVEMLNYIKKEDGEILIKISNDLKENEIEVIGFSLELENQITALLEKF